MLFGFVASKSTGFAMASVSTDEFQNELRKAIDKPLLITVLDTHLVTHNFLIFDIISSLSTGFLLNIAFRCLRELCRLQSRPVCRRRRVRKQRSGGFGVEEDDGVEDEDEHEGEDYDNLDVRGGKRAAASATAGVSGATA